VLEEKGGTCTSVSPMTQRAPWKHHGSANEGGK
jgi:hypothetical protein